MLNRRGRGAEVLWIEYALPQTVETNEQLKIQHPEWNMEETYRRTGVRKRPIARAGEYASCLALRACQALFENSNVPPSQVDGLIFCTQSPDYIMPPNSSLLHQRLGLRPSAAAFDVTLACSGYLYCLSLAKALIESEQMDSVLVVNADTYSKYIHPDDRACRTLFGDGAAATLVGAGEQSVGSIALGTDGGAGQCFTLGRACRDTDAGPHSTPRTASSFIAASGFIAMDGLQVLGSVKRIIPGFVADLLAEAGRRPSDMDVFVFHQASKLALDQLAEALEVDPERVLSNLETRGNLVSASIPVALRDGWNDGRIRTGQQALLIAFGAGFSWGGCILKLTTGFMKPKDAGAGQKENCDRTDDRSELASVLS